MAKKPPQPARRPPQRVRHYVKEWRLHRHLTQEQLAERIGRSRGLVTQIETGLTDLTGETIYALAEALNIEPGDLFRINPAREGKIIDITDILRGADAGIQAEALGYIRGLIASSKH